MCPEGERARWQGIITREPKEWENHAKNKAE